MDGEKNRRIILICSSRVTGWELKFAAERCDKLRSARGENHFVFRPLTLRQVADNPLAAGFNANRFCAAEV